MPILKYPTIQFINRSRETRVAQQIIHEIFGFIHTTILWVRNDTRTCVKILIIPWMAKDAANPFRIRVLLPGMVFLAFSETPSVNK